MYSLVWGRLIFAMNQFNVAAVFPLMAVEMNQGIGGLGSITSTFYAGMAIFQVPGGLIAAKIGPKRTLVLGTFVYSACALFTGFALAMYQIAVLRFLVGAGMALNLAPGVGLVAKHFRRGGEGLGVGLLVAAYFAGGAAGLFAWAFLSQFTGWRLALIASGVLGLVSAVLLLVMIPKDIIRPDFRITRSALGGVLLDRWIIILSLVLLGITVGTTLSGNFTIFYLESSLRTDPGLAGLIGAFSLIFGFVASPFSGRMYDRHKNVKTFGIISLAVVAAGLALPSLNTLLAAGISTILVGLGSGVAWTILFTAVRDANKAGVEYDALAVSWANSISTLTFWAPLLFSFVVTSSGYGLGWLIGGFVTFAWVIPMVIARERQGAH